MTSKQVVVTGLGLMTGLGLDLESSWQGLLAGKSPIRPFSLFDPKGMGVGFGVELPDGADALFAAHIKHRQWTQMTRTTRMAVVIGEMALEDSRVLAGGVNSERIGVVLGTTGTGYIPTDSTVDQHRILRNMPNSPAAWISMKWKLNGPSLVVGTACSSGSYALNIGWMLIVTGQCDAVLVGAADSSLNALDVQGFGSLMALSEGQGDIATSSRPFDKHRNGFVMGEGGGFLLLESADSAQRRAARIYATMSMPALYSEAYNIISPQKNGTGMAKAMQLALDHAGLKPTDIDYINAHGTSTVLNDLYETLAIKQVFGQHAHSLAVSSTKSMTGHCLAAAAGVEAVICCKALVEGIIPPTANLKEQDPELDLDFVPGEPRCKTLSHVMSNSFAFGGHNGVNIFSRP